MITDATLLFDTDKAIASAGLTFSDNVLDLSMIRDIGDGECLHMLITVTESFASTTSGAVQFGLAVSATSAMGSPAYLVNSAPYISAQLTAYDPATMAPATQILVPVPGLISALNASIGANGQRYMSAVYTVANSFTDGKVRAELVLNPQVVNGRTYYSKSYTVI